MDSVAFEGRGGFRYIEVQGKEWFVNEITVDDSVYSLTENEQKLQKQGGELVKTFDWLTIKTNSNRVTISVSINNGVDWKSRDFSIEFNHRNSYFDLRGTQDVLLDGECVVDLISPSSRTVKFDSKVGSSTITMKTDFTKIIGVEIEGKYNPVNYNNWQDYVLDKRYEWLNVRHEDAVLELITEENPTEESRTFKIHLEDGDYFTTVTGIQQAAVDIPPTDTIGFAPSKVRFPLEGGTLEVVARTGGWIIDEKSEGLDWLTIEQDSNCLKLTATPNFDYDIRHFALRFKKGNYYEYLEGEQETR